MSSGQESPAGPAKDITQIPAEMSTPTSPTDNRHPLARFETIESVSQQGDGLSESFQSTDTIRRRPEPQSYGMHVFYISWEI